MESDSVGATTSTTSVVKPEGWMRGRKLNVGDKGCNSDRQWMGV